MKLQHKNRSIARTNGRRRKTTGAARRHRLAVLAITLGLWASSIIAIAEYWRSEVPAVRAVGARATIHRVIEYRQRVSATSIGSDYW